MGQVPCGPCFDFLTAAPVTKHKVPHNSTSSHSGVPEVDPSEGSQTAESCVASLPGVPEAVPPKELQSGELCLVSVHGLPEANPSTGLQKGKPCVESAPGVPEAYPSKGLWEAKPRAVSVTGVPEADPSKALQKALKLPEANPSTGLQKAEPCAISAFGLPNTDSWKESQNAEPHTASALENKEDDNLDIDLVKLCAAFDNLEQSTQIRNDPMARTISGSSTPRLASGQTAQASTASPWRGSGNHVRKNPLQTASSYSSNTAPEYSTPDPASGLHTPSSSGQLSVPLGEGTSNAVSSRDYSSPGAMAGRIRDVPRMDAAKMDAWFQRVLAKGEGPKPGFKSMPPNAGHQPLARPATQKSWSDDPIILPTHVNASANVTTEKTAMIATPTTTRSSTMTPTPATVTEVVTEDEDEGPSNGLIFRLEVRLSGDDLGILKFRVGERIEIVCKAFVEEHRLRDIFKAPLETHLELMVHMNKRHDAVDVIDLI